MWRGLIKGLTSINSKEIGKEIALAGVAAFAGYMFTVYLENRSKKNNE